MAYTILDLKTDLEAILHGTSLDSVTSPSALINRAARDVLNEVDPQETKRIVTIPNAIYDKVYDYQLPDDVKGNRIISLAPQVNREVGDKATQRFWEEFDQYKRDLDFHVQYNKGVRSLRFSKALKTATVLNAMNDITDNGTWVVGGDATNLRKDTLQYISGNASLKFDVTGAGTTAYLENTTSDTQDISDIEDDGALFAWVFMPNVITSAELRWWSSSSNYWSQTTTTRQDNLSFQEGWNLIRFDWDTASSVGSPDSSDITYLRLTITYDGIAANNYRFDNITAQQGAIWQLIYYSKYLFEDGTTGAWKENTDDDADIVNLDTDSYNLLLYKVAELAAQQIQAEDSAFDLQYFMSKYAQELVIYKNKYKSEVKSVKQKYYRITGIDDVEGFNIRAARIRRR